MEGLESSAFGMGQTVVDQLPTTTHVYVECSFYPWCWPFN